MKHLLAIILSTILATTSIHAQGYKQALELGSVAPEINGLDQNQDEVSLSEILGQGKSAVVIFYRGNWCGYCQKHLSLMQDSLEYVLDQNASVIVVTPETPDAVESMVSKTGATFSILHDEGYSIMKAYNVDYVISPETVTKYLGPVTKRTAIANGNDEGVLPVPATYIINPEHKIKWIHFDPVYSKRSSVYQILMNLD